MPIVTRISRKAEVTSTLRVEIKEPTEDENTLAVTTLGELPIYQQYMGARGRRNTIVADNTRGAPSNT